MEASVLLLFGKGLRVKQMQSNGLLQNENHQGVTQS